MLSRFGDQPGLLYVAATLVPLASFVVILTLGALKNLGRRYRDAGWGGSLYWLLGGDEPGRGGAYLATGAIALSCVLAVAGLVLFLGEPEHARAVRRALHSAEVSHAQAAAAGHAPADYEHP